MRSDASFIDPPPKKQQLIRYIINGLVATAVHFSVLTFNLDVLGFQSAGVANLFAAIAGIGTSFLGGRYYVFENKDGSFAHQLGKFVLLYATIACLHGLILLVWTDSMHLDYRAGFLLATAVQVSLSYFGNKLLVFNR